MIYGDGAFKDPAGKIWELADPVVSPGYTSGLIGTPNELKLKYLADKDFADLKGDALQQAISEKIRQKDAKVSLVGNMISEGTTPRNLTDLIGSLCDLTSGSGDKGTPLVYIQGYFDNYTTDSALSHSPFPFLSLFSFPGRAGILPARPPFSHAVLALFPAIRYNGRRAAIILLFYAIFSRLRREPNNMASCKQN